MSISTILFNLGGVVCQYDRRRRVDAIAALSRFSADQIEAELYGGGLTSIWAHGRYNSMQIYLRMREQFGLDVTFAELGKTWALAFRPDPEVLALAERVGSARRVGLLTDNDPLLLEVFPDHFPEAAQLFDPLLFSCDFGAVKAEAALFDAVLQRLETDAEQVLLIDDAAEHVATARERGLHAHHYTGAADLHHELTERNLLG